MPTDEEKQRVKEMLVRQLRLRMDPAAIEDAAPLFGDGPGLGLDSVDAIELVAGIEQTFCVVISNEEEARSAFASVNALASWLAERDAFLST
ncbi:MAG: acyl carrier protein [Planctomycetes bacterium]|nr:acyl carrier protein [Planctomycetota bacterium]